MDAGSLLRSCRERAGLTQRELAEAAGTSAAAICLYESGERIPRTDTLMRIVAAAGSTLQMGLSHPNPIDPAVADRALQAALQLAGALPYEPAEVIQAPVFAHLAS